MLLSKAIGSLFSLFTTNSALFSLFVLARDEDSLGEWVVYVKASGVILLARQVFICRSIPRCQSAFSDAKEKLTDDDDEKSSAQICLGVDSRRHLTDSAASRRWLVLMEPINAVFIACTLGAKVRFFSQF